MRRKSSSCRSSCASGPTCRCRCRASCVWGYRLSGDAIQPRRNGIVSEGIAYGAIQIPSDGQPIVLLKDRQTIGGYPKIGCLSALGAGQLAQRGPGSLVRFHPMDVSQAEAQRMIFNHTFGL